MPRVEEVLGRPLAAVIDPPSAAAVVAALSGDRFQEENPLRVSARGRSFDGIVHRHLGAAILELEPLAPQSDPRACTIRCGARSSSCKTRRRWRSSAAPRCRKCGG